MVHGYVYFNRAKLNSEPNAQNLKYILFVDIVAQNVLPHILWIL